MDARQESPRHGSISVPSADMVLLTPKQLAERLAVPASWIRERTRRRARVRDTDPLPVVRLGKYIRFDWRSIQEWLARQGDLTERG